MAKKKVLVTGAGGYIGNALMAEIDKDFYDVIGVDNDLRERLAHRVSGISQIGNTQCDIIFGDLASRDFVMELLAVHRPDVIIHLASQPSMPYSQINGERALFTQVNNLSMNLNLLWAMKELGLKSRYIITTTTGIPGQFYDTIPEDTTQNKAGSWYHASRGFDSVNCELANKQWGQEVIEFRTAIVYGIQTPKMKEDEIMTRFDTDFYFGTVLNRFIDQAIKEQPITIYGKGLQQKPFIALRDVVWSLINAIDYKFDKSFTILNQATEMKSIIDIAEMIRGELSCDITHIDNPRVEKEEFNMLFENGKFLEVLGDITPMTAEIPEMITTLQLIAR